MSAKVEARRRAREAKAALDADRVARDKQIEETTTAFYIAANRIDDLHEQLASAFSERNQHIKALRNLGETVDRIAILTGMTTKDIRQAIRRARAHPADNR